jgi:uncharacterized membrane protein
MKMSKLTFAAVVLIAFVPLALAQGKYTQIDVPGAYSTQCDGVDSAGNVVGFFEDSNQNTHGYLLSGGTFTTLDAPGAVYTVALGINDLGQIVGFDDTGSFLYDVTTQTFTQFSSSFANSTTSASAINNAGTIVGSLTVNQTNGPAYGFELKNTKYVKVAFPESRVKATALSSINNLGEAIGQVVVGLTTRSFSYAQHKFTTIAVPGIPDAVAAGLNDQGAIVGSFVSTSTAVLGFVYQNGSVQQLDFPGSSSTYTRSINNSGEVVGFFFDSNNLVHGFTWTPPADAAKK